ncbi:MAG TPA: serine/threonine-protein kinase [Bryobacteraceae bacterium]|nr:serine/threonine-protein kinase [Bryobacteraceae bacterium]
MSVNWQQLQEIFDQVCSLDEDQRHQALDRQCKGDHELHREVLKLVRAYDAERAAAAEGNASPSGARFGAWQTMRMVARGGMGEVWLARRADGEHEQRAALKILSPYLAAPDSLDRFRRERQLLARLEHPNIARLLDGGRSPRGEPYLVMEYVDGVRLDRYCDQHRLSIPQRLQLMIKVCAAVNAAHQYLIVHRDLKPGNILVTEGGEPKLLDFGIAKMIDAEAGGERTATVNQFLTPTYASPEVLRGEPATVASDVYSLGVLLYELLAGCRPFEMFGVTPAAEWERAVRDTAPSRPTRLTEAAAEKRSTTSARLRQTLAGDLTTILEKALRHEPAQRYQSAERLAEDLQLYLSNRPILARPQTVRYRAAKFVARHRWPVGLAAMALVGAALGVVSTVAEKRVAERRFEEVRRLAHYVLFDLYDDVSNLSGSARVRGEMARRATDYLNTLSREAKSDRGLRLELAEGYLRLGDIQGNMFRTNLGDTRAALATYQKGLDLLAPLGNDRGAVRLRTSIELHRAQATDSNLANREDFDRLRTAVDHFEKLAGSPPSIEDSYQLGQAYTLLGALEQQHGGWVAVSSTEGASELDRAEGYLRRAVEQQPADPAYAYSFANLLDRRAMAYALLQPERSIAYDRQVSDVVNRVREPDRDYPSFRILLSNAQSHLVFAYGQINQFDAGLEHARTSEQILLPLLAASPDDNDLRYRLAVVRRLAGIVEGYDKRWTESAAYFAKGIADYDILLRTGPNPAYSGYQAELRMRMADDFWEAGRKPEAETAAEAGLAEFRDLANAPGATFPVLRQAANYLLFTEVTTLRDPREALALAERGRKLSSDPFKLYELLGAAYAANDRYREAAESERKALNELPPVKPGEKPSRARQSTEESLAAYEREAKAMKK